MHGMVSIAALIVNIFKDECESFIYYLNLIFGYHLKPLFTSDKIKVVNQSLFSCVASFIIILAQVEYFNQFFH